MHTKLSVQQFMTSNKTSRLYKISLYFEIALHLCKDSNARKDIPALRIKQKYHFFSKQLLPYSLIYKVYSLQYFFQDKCYFTKAKENF